jgi:hypothetical protein
VALPPGVVEEVDPLCIAEDDGRVGPGRSVAGGTLPYHDANLTPGLSPIGDGGAVVLEGEKRLPAVPCGPTTPPGGLAYGACARPWGAPRNQQKRQGGRR